jgi:hypothetical protein
LVGTVEESTLLEAVTREGVVKTADLKDLACAVVICKAWKLAIYSYDL